MLNMLPQKCLWRESQWAELWKWEELRLKFGFKPSHEIRSKSSPLTEHILFVQSMFPYFNSEFFLKLMNTYTNAITIYYKIATFTELILNFWFLNFPHDDLALGDGYMLGSISPLHLFKQRISFWKSTHTVSSSKGSQSFDPSMSFNVWWLLLCHQSALF